MNRIPRPQEIYRHFKGKNYQVLTLAEDTESGKCLVIYQALYGSFKVYARDLELFMSPVDRVKYPNVSQQDRFELIGNVQAEEPVSAESPVATPEKEPTENIPPEEGQTEQPNIDPMVLEFLDARTYEERLNILTGLHHRITDDMITTMSIVCDIEVPEGDVESRYLSLRNSLLIKEKFECNRLR